MTELRTRAPRVSVCLLAYNHEHILADAVESVLAQDLDDFELIISDDQSTDGTWELAQSFEARDPRVRAVRTPRNLGMAGNTNFAFALARAPYVALLHHDDECSPALLRRWAEVLDRHPDVGFVSCAYRTPDGTPTVEALDERNDGTWVLESYLLARWDCIFRGTAMIRRSAWDRVGGMREQFGMLADVDLWMRLARVYAVGYVRDAFITPHAVRPDYYPKDYWQWSWRRVRLLYEIHAANCAEYRRRGTLSGELHWLKLRTRVTGHTAFWLSYAVARRRWSMLTGSRDVATPLELPPGRAYRHVLARVGSWLEKSG